MSVHMMPMAQFILLCRKAIEDGEADIIEARLEQCLDLLDASRDVRREAKLEERRDAIAWMKSKWDVSGNGNYWAFGLEHGQHEGASDE